jgi:hypothetical protein
MRTAAQRIAHYNARMQSTLIDPVLTAVNAAAVANYTAYAIDFVPKQSQARALFDSDGLMGPIRLLYEAYVGELYGLTKRFSGSALDAMAQVLHDKYEALGCATASLISVAAGVFGITVT